MNLLLKFSRFFHDLQVYETLSSKFIVVLFIPLRFILSSILHIEHCECSYLLFGIYIYIYIQIDRQIDRQIGRQIDRQIYRVQRCHKDVCFNNKLLQELVGTKNKHFQNLKDKGKISDKQLRFFTCQNKKVTNLG